MFLRFYLATTCCRNSVRPLNAWIVTERNKLNRLSKYQRHTIERCFWFLEAEFRGREFRDPPPNESIKETYSLSKAQIRPIIYNDLETVQDRV